MENRLIFQNETPKESFAEKISTAPSNIDIRREIRAAESFLEDAIKINPEITRDADYSRLQVAISTLKNLLGKWDEGTLEAGEKSTVVAVSREFRGLMLVFEAMGTDKNKYEYKLASDQAIQKMKDGMMHGYEEQNSLFGFDKNKIVLAMYNYLNDPGNAFNNTLQDGEILRTSYSEKGHNDWYTAKKLGGRWSVEFDT